MWRTGRAGPSSRSPRSYSCASAARSERTASSGPWLGCTRVAARDRHRRARLAHRGELGHALADQRDDRARAVTEREPQVLAVAVRAQLAVAHEQNLLDVLAVDELANEHGTQR